MSNSDFWDAAERAHEEVKKWPAWRREGYSAATRGKKSMPESEDKHDDLVEECQEIIKQLSTRDLECLLDYLSITYTKDDE